VAVTAVSDDRHPESVAVAERRRLGMWLFLASLGMLIGGSLVGFLVIRLRAEQWPPAGSPGLPVSFLISTAILAVISALLIAAERAVRAGSRTRPTALLGAAVVLGIAFILSQIAGWARLAQASELPQTNLYLFGIYVLSFLHLLHVVGGLVPLVWVTLRARSGRYTADDHEGVTLTGMYWHFLGIAWLAILAVLAL
jgi:heme/copper-type cytochrome/quinol oxidase subunit 3